MKIVIEGAGEVGSHIAKLLSQDSNDICVIDNDPERLERLNTIADVETIEGKTASIKVLQDAKVHDADLFVAVNPFTPQDVNIVSTLLAKKLGAKKVIARIDDEEFLSPENKLIFKQMGIEFMFYPERIAANEIVDLLKNSGVTDSIDFAKGKLQVSTFKLDENSPLLGMKLDEFVASLSSDELQFRIIAISRQGETMIPRYDTRFQFNDLVFFITKKEALDTLMRFLGKNFIQINNVIILGGNPIGEMVARKLSNTKAVDEIKIIESDKHKCQELSERLNSDISIINGDGRNSDFLLEEGINYCDAFVALTGNDEANVLACISAKRFGVERTIAEVENIEYIRLAEDMGVDAVINKKLITAGKIYKFTLSGKARMVKYMSGTNAEVLEYIVAPGSKITKGCLQEINFPENAIIGGIVRGNESFIAIGTSRIEAYDRVAVFALPHVVKEVDKMFIV